jgi:hypothetical protein
VTLPETFPVTGYVELAEYLLVPSNQPANEKPVRVKVFSGVVKVDPVFVVVGVVGAEPDPPPCAYVMLAETEGTAIDLTTGSLGFVGQVLYKVFAPALPTRSLASTAK